MSIRVKSFLKDVGGAGRVTKARREKLKNASAVPDPKAVSYTHLRSPRDA